MTVHAGDSARSKRRLLAAGAAFLVGGSLALSMAPRLLGQPPTPDGNPPAFESVSVKPSASAREARGGARIQPGGRWTATNVTLRTVIQAAYQRHGFDVREVTGGPAWLDERRFDIEAKAAREHSFDPDGVPRRTLAMLRTLLAERFKLKVHEERKELPIYALVAAGTGGQLGPKLRKSEIGCGALLEKMIAGARPPAADKGPVCAHASYPGRLVANAIAIPDLASILSRFVDRLVVDRTGLSGAFDVEIEAVEIQPPGPFGPSYRPSDTKKSIFAALPEQLGLRLDATQGAAEIVVVDHVQHP
jgi:uncharacterized protein (TIGR03435 family)